MNNGQHSAIIASIPRIVGDVLHDVYVRGKYRDLIFPTIVIRRVNALFEPTKQAALKTKAKLHWAAKVGITNQDGALRLPQSS